MSKVTVIIPNYNGKHFLEPCLDSLKLQTMSEFDVFVVDNGSSDGSADFVREKYPGVKLIEMGLNTGFCGAVNEGVKNTETKYFILLNNDTVVSKRFIEVLVKSMDANPKAFSCCSCVLDMNHPDKIDSAGDLYSAFGWAYARGKGKSPKKYNKPVRVFSSSACAAAYRTDLFKKLGMMDVNHFAYLEDLDIGYRARVNGYENLYVPEAKVFHYGSGTSGSLYNEFKVSLSSRNNVYIIYKNMPCLQRLLNAPFIMVGFAVKWFYFKKMGFGELYLQGLKEGGRLAQSEEGKKQRVRFQPSNIKNYCVIQLELWFNMFRRTFP